MIQHDDLTFAVAEVERLQARNADLIAALEEIANGSAITLAFEWREVAERMQKIARAAIAKEMP